MVLLFTGEQTEKGVYLGVKGLFIPSITFIKCLISSTCDQNFGTSSAYFGWFAMLTVLNNENEVIKIANEQNFLRMRNMLL